MHQGVHHPAGAAVEVPLDGRARSLRIPARDRIHDGVVLAAGRLLERGMIHPQGDDPHDLVQAVPDEVRDTFWISVTVMGVTR
jgi:hypothetical protein